MDQNNPHYEHGVFKGTQIVSNIESTIWGDLETALESKEQLVKDLKEQFGWDESHQDVAEALGMIAALKKAIQEEESKPKHNLEPEDVTNIAGQIGMKVTEEQIETILSQYLSAQEDDPGATWDLVIENLIHDSNNGNI